MSLYFCMLNSSFCVFLVFLVVSASSAPCSSFFSFLSFLVCLSTCVCVLWATLPELNKMNESN